MSFKRLSILGSIITRVAIFTDLIDLEDNNFHSSCTLNALELGCLDDMGLLHLKCSIQCFAILGPI